MIGGVLRVAEVVSITNGTLLNTPSITAFAGITLELDSLKHGWLFIARNHADIESALAKGAYGVISKSPVEIKESEIAYIEVRDIEDAIARLIRYKILFFSTNVIALNLAQLLIAKEIITDASIFVGDCKNTLLESFNQEIRVIFTNSDEILTLSFHSLQALKPLDMPFNLITYTLFDMRLSYNSRAYFLHLPYFFINDLSSLVCICEQEHVLFDFTRFHRIQLLRPIFIDEFSHICEYGQSQQVLITQQDCILFASFVRYFLEYAKWGKLVCMLPKSHKLETLDSIKDLEILFYEQTNDILDCVMETNFNFMLIFGIDDSRLYTLLQNHGAKNQPSLFDNL